MRFCCVCVAAEIVWHLQSYEGEIRLGRHGVPVLLTVTSLAVLAFHPFVTLKFMPNYNYSFTDANGKKQGPLDVQQLQTLVDQGIITPMTPLETDDGDQEDAGRIPALKFDSAALKSYSAFVKSREVTMKSRESATKSREAAKKPRIPVQQTSTEGSPLDFLDFGFTRFITNTWISFIWIVIVILVILAYVSIVSFGLFAMSQGNEGGIAGLGVIMLATIMAPLYLLFARIGLELIIVIFRIETHLRSIREHYEKK